MKLISENALEAQDSNYFFEFKNILFGVSCFRLVIFSAVFVSVILLQILQSDFLCIEIWQPINLAMMVSFLAHVAYVEFSSREKWAETSLKALLFFDCLILAVWLAIAGVQHSAFLFLLLVIIALGSLSLGLGTGMKLGLWAAALFNIVCALNPQFNPELMKATWLVNNVSIFIVASLGGVLGDQVSYVASDIESQKDEIQTLTDTNKIIVDNIPSGLLMIDANGLIRSANRGAAKILNDLSLENRALTEVFPALAMAVQSFSLQHKGKSTERFELNYYNLKNEKMILEVILSVVKKKTESNSQYLCLMQNLTEVKNLEFAMQQKEKLAAVGQLAAGIAHEIRNPLASISGSIQLLQGNLQTQTPEDKKLLSIVVKEIDRLNGLITEFLDFVRPDVRVVDPININNLAKEILDMTKVNTLLSPKVEQRTELRAQNMILGHYDKLKQALLNIVINAYQAMGDTLRPEIFIQSYDADGQVVLVIQDNGIGMTSDNMKRIFEPFHTTKPKGTGLGLAITHKILESHGVQVFVESELGQGSKFTLAFPTTQSPEFKKNYIKKQA